MAERASPDVLTRWAVACGLGLIPLSFLAPGTSDVAVQTSWLQQALVRGPVAGYDVVDYPPGTTLLLWSVTKALNLPVEHAVKLVSSVFLVVGALLIGRVVSGKAALATVLVFAYPTMILGYTDALFLPPLTIAAFSRYWGQRFVALAALVALKWTALILCPVFLAIWVADVARRKPFQVRQVVRDLFPASCVAVAFANTYGPRTLINQLLVTTSNMTGLSGNAFNVHWLISWFWFDNAPYGSDVYDSISILYRLFFQVLVASAITALGLAAAWKAQNGHQRLACLRAAVVVYFLFAAFSVHENHLFLAVALSIMVWGRGWERWTTTAILAAAYLLNLFLYYGSSGTQGPLYSIGDLGLAVGLAVVACLTWVGARDLLLAFSQLCLTVEMRNAQR